MTITIRHIDQDNIFDRGMTCTGCSGSEARGYEDISATVELNVRGNTLRFCDDCRKAVKGLL